MFGNLSQLWCHHWQTVKLTSSYFPLSAQWHLAFRQILSLSSLPPITLKKSDSGKNKTWIHSPLLHFCTFASHWEGGQVARERVFQVLAMEPPSRGWWGEKGSYQVLCNWKTSTCHFKWDGGVAVIFFTIWTHPPPSPIQILQFPFLYFIKLTFLGSTPGQRIRNLGDFSGHCPSGHNWKHLKIKSVEKSL